MWKNKKPDRDGVWIWRFPKHHDRMGVILVQGKTVIEMGDYPAKKYDIDIWWDISYVDTFYVNGAQDEIHG
jgi:hypothetical protein